MDLPPHLILEAKNIRLRCVPRANSSSDTIEMTNTPLFLTPGPYGQVAELTGARTRKRQIRTLQQNGIRHTLNAAGWPVVSLSTIESPGAKAHDATAWQSNALK